MKENIECPKCFRCWPVDCEQAISVEMYGECVVCKFTPQGKGSNDGTPEQLHEVRHESELRRMGLSTTRRE